MRRTLLLKTMLLLCTLVAGVGNVWGTTYTGIFRKITSTGDFTTGYYIVAASESASSNANYALGNSVDSNGRMTGVSVSITNGTTITNPSDAIVWYITVSGSTITMKNVSNDKYLYQASTTSGKGMGLKDASTNLTLDSYSSSSPIGFKITLNGASTNFFKYNAGSKWFANYANAYSTSMTPVRLFKLHTYTLSYSAENGSISGVDAGSNAVASGGNVGEGTTVTLTATPASGYEFAEWSVSGTGAALSSTSTNPTTFTMGTANATVTATFTSSSTVATPTFSVAEGTYNTTQSVEINCGTDGATIYYTLDGTTPTTSSSEYSSAVSIDATKTLKAIAVKDGLDDSEVASATYTLKCATPTISQAAGAVTYGTIITLSCATEGATIYYTTDGSTPSSSSTAYNPEAKPTITAAGTFKTIAIKDNWSDSEISSAEYTIKNPSAPVFSETGGAVLKGSTITLSSAVGTTIRYTTDGSTTPTNTVGTVYSSAITINADQTIKAVAYDAGGNCSSVASCSFIAFDGTIVTFDASSDTGTSLLKSGVSFTTSATEGNVYKWYKSSKPTFAVTNGKIKRIEFTGVSGYAISNMTAATGSLNTSDSPNGVWTGSVSSVQFTASSAQARASKVKVCYAVTATPTFSVSAGEYSAAKSVELSCATDGATIYYTTNGSTPTSSSTEYTGAINITETTTLKAIAIKDGVESTVASATYTMNRPAAPEFDVDEGYFAAAFDLHLSAVDGATIYYTTDGSTPTTISSVYSTKVAITAATTTVKAIAVKEGLTSDVASATYTYDSRPAPTFSLSDSEMTILVLSDDETITLTTNSDGAVTFTSSNDTNLEVDNSDNSKIGVLSAYVAGDYTITVQTAATENYLAGEGTVTVHVVKKTTTMAIDTDFSDGKDLQYASTGLIGGTVKYNDVALSPQPTIIYSSSDEKVATVDEYGEITFKNEGTTTITVSFAGNDEYLECANTYVLDLIDTTPQETSVDITLNNTFFDCDAFTSWTTGMATSLSGKSKRITVSYNKGTSSNMYCNAEKVRFYTGNTFSITAPTGYHVTEVDMGVSISSASPTGEISSDTWSGDASSVSFTFANKTDLTDISVTLAPTVTIGASSYASYCSHLKLNYTDTDVKAYKAAVVEGKVTLTQVNVVPANEGIVLYCETPGTYTVPVTTASASDVTGNEMVGVTEETDVVWNPSSGVYNYILQSGVFKKASTGKLRANRAYLSTSYDVTAAGARELQIVFDDNTTAISTIVNSQELNANGIYDLQGRKVMNPVKGGLYIMNGKKVVIK